MERETASRNVGEKNKPGEGRMRSLLRPSGVAMSRSRHDQAFTIRATERLIKAAQRRGLKKYRIAISPEDGRPATYSLVVDETDTKPATETDSNPWDEVLTDAAHEKRPA
jgi:hypothetical protein